MPWETGCAARVIGEEFRKGNDAPAARNLEFNRCEADYKAPVLLAIGADLDASAENRITWLPRRIYVKTSLSVRYQKGLFKSIANFGRPYLKL
ncbi:MAG: hypothetical protein HZA15_11505 [Nitrospirae bacterium]|nr:hypothetical protein [Nitrospirota bacterium]